MLKQKRKAFDKKIKIAMYYITIIAYVSKKEASICLFILYFELT